jgi:trigger factor
VKATAEKTEKNTVKLEIEVDAQQFEEAMQKSYIKNRKNIAIPGFRKGRVPRKIIETYYSEAVFYEDAVNDVCPKAYLDAVKEQGIEPVDQPEFDIVQIGQGQNLIFTAEVTVKPEVELGEYKGIEVQKVEYNVTEQDVEQRLKQLQEQNARWISADDREVRNDDRVTLDYQGSVDGELFEGGSAENQSLEIGSGQFIPGFEEQLVGMKVGEENDIKVTFPEEYHAAELSGKEAVFHVKINEIKEKELPELDDEFAKDISEFDTLEDYKADLVKNMEKSAKDSAKAEMENSLIKEIVDRCTVDIPDVMVEHQVDHAIYDFEYTLMYRGLTLEQYLQFTNTSMDDFRAQYRDEAYNTVKTQLVLEKIGKEEKIEVTDQDVDADIKRLAEENNIEEEKVREYWKGQEAYLKENLLFQKTVDFLMENAVIVDKKEENKEA